MSPDEAASSGTKTSDARPDEVLRQPRITYIRGIPVDLAQLSPEQHVQYIAALDRFGEEHDRIVDGDARLRRIDQLHDELLPLFGVTMGPPPGSASDSTRGGDEVYSVGPDHFGTPKQQAVQLVGCGLGEIETALDAYNRKETEDGPEPSPEQCSILERFKVLHLVAFHRSGEEAQCRAGAKYGLTTEEAVAAGRLGSALSRLLAKRVAEPTGDLCNPTPLTPRPLRGTCQEWCRAESPAGVAVSRARAATGERAALAASPAGLPAAAVRATTPTVNRHPRTAGLRIIFYM